MINSRQYTFSVTTQGPTYPPSEVMDEQGNFVVIGMINDTDEQGHCGQQWGGAIVSSRSRLPEFGANMPYDIIERFDWQQITAEQDCVLHTLPLPLPCNNYPVTFAPQQHVRQKEQPSSPLHLAPIPDVRPNDGLKVTHPIRLSDWVKAQGSLTVTVLPDKRHAKFEMEFDALIPDSLYTVMALRELDLDPINGPTRPGPLGVPNVLITDNNGRGHYTATMPNPFPSCVHPGHNRIVNVVLLWMSTQMSYGGAIGHFGLGADIHAQLKLPGKFFTEFETYGGT